MLIDSRLRRQGHEQRALAVQMINTYAEATNPKAKDTGGGGKVSSRATWDMMGAPKRRAQKEPEG
jgi:hypothetical protein